MIHFGTLLSQFRYLWLDTEWRWRKKRNRRRYCGLVSVGLGACFVVFICYPCKTPISSWAVGVASDTVVAKPRGSYSYCELNLAHPSWPKPSGSQELAPSACTICPRPHSHFSKQACNNRSANRSEDPFAREVVSGTGLFLQER